MMKISERFKENFKEEFVGLQEISNFFGITHATIRRAIDTSDVVKFVKIGYLIRIDVDSFAKYLDENENKKLKDCARTKKVKKKPRGKAAAICEGEKVYKDWKKAQ